MFFSLIPEDAIVVLQDTSSRRFVFFVTDADDGESFALDLALVVERPVTEARDFGLALGKPFLVVSSSIELIPGLLDREIAAKIFATPLFASATRLLGDYNGSSLQQSTYRSAHEF